MRNQTSTYNDGNSGPWAVKSKASGTVWWRYQTRQAATKTATRWNEDIGGDFVVERIVEEA